MIYTTPQVSKTCGVSDVEEHHQAVLKLYQKLYEKAPKFEYKQRIEELQKGSMGGGYNPVLDLDWTNFYWTKQFHMTLPMNYRTIAPQRSFKHPTLYYIHA